MNSGPRAGGAAAGGDFGGRCRRLFAADGRGRGGHARGAEGDPPRAGRSKDRGAPRPHRQDHRRRAPRRIRQRCRCGALCGRVAARDGRAQCRHRRQSGGSSSASVSILATSSSRTATSTAMGSIRGAARGAGRAGRLRVSLVVRDRSATSRLRFRGSRRATGQEHRSPDTGYRIPLAGDGSRQRRRCHCPTSRRWRCCRFRTCRATPSRNISPTASSRRSRPRSPAFLAVRDRPQFELHLQGQGGRCEAGGARVGRALRARRLGAESRQPGAHHRPADRRGDGRASLGRPLRRRLDDIFELQDQVATRVVGVIEPGCASPKPSAPPASRPRALTPTTSTCARWRRHTKEPRRHAESIPLGRRAPELEPAFAPAMGRSPVRGRFSCTSVLFRSRVKRSRRGSIWRGRRSPPPGMIRK